MTNPSDRGVNFEPSLPGQKWTVVDTDIELPAVSPLDESSVRARWAALVGKRRCCGRPIYARGMCRPCYSRWYKSNFHRLTRNWEGGRRIMVE